MTEPPATGSRGRLAGRLIGLGVTGSIAAYKAVELLRLLRAEGADVAVMLTPSATRFVGPLSFAALSRHPVETELLELTATTAGSGTSWSATRPTRSSSHRRPPTGSGAMANGLAGDVVTATCLATSAPVVVAPAMDGDMWTHPATVANVARLRELRLRDRRARVRAAGVGPVGRRAAGRARVDRGCGRRGRRRSPDPCPRPGRPAAARRARPRRRPRRPARRGDRRWHARGRSTRSASSAIARPGRMGVAIAEAALDRGARVTVIAANVEVALPPGARRRRGRLDRGSRRRPARDDSLARRLGRVRCPGDGRGGRRLPAGRPRRDEAAARARALTLELEPTPDLLAEIARIVRGSRQRRARRPRNRSGPPRSWSGSRPRPARPRARRRQAAPQGRRPAGRQRRGRGRFGVRDRHQPGHDLRRERLTRRAAAPVEAGRRGSSCSTGSLACWTSATRPRRLVPRPSPNGSQHERHERHHPPPDRQRHRASCTPTASGSRC